MKRQFLYILIFISFFTACLDSPDMTTGIVNGKEKPTVETDATGTLYNNGNLLIQGKILSEGKSKISKRGFYWGYVSDKLDSTIESYDNTDIFTCELMDVLGDTTYYWRAFATNDFGYELADSVYFFRTPKDEPEVVTISIDTLINDGIILFKGEIKSQGRSEIIERGFYWSAVSNNPDSTDNIIRIADADSDSFSVELKGVSGNSTYYCRAYAINSSDYYGYGDILSCKAPEIWEQKNPLNTVYHRGSGAVYTVNNKIYITCGEKEGRVPTSENWEYGITTGTWANLFDFPYGARIELSVFTIGNLAYLGTGRSSSQQEGINDFYMYDSAIDKWAEIATPENFAARYLATAFSLNGKGYVVGGYGTSALNDVWQYDPVKNSWERKDDFPASAFYGGISVFGNNRAFAGLGRASGSARILWEYIEEKDEWIPYTEELPYEAGRIIYSGVIIRNTIYIVDSNNVIWACDISSETKTWKKKADLPENLLWGEHKESGYQTLLTTGNSNSIYVGLGYTINLYEYRPLWDN